MIYSVRQRRWEFVFFGLTISIEVKKKKNSDHQDGDEIQRERLLLLAVTGIQTLP